MMLDSLIDIRYETYVSIYPVTLRLVYTIRDPLRLRNGSGSDECTCM
jgi:hypothetical protein